ncbi:myomodulin neuropeptides 2-like [Mya arenaria]|uniref:myomodulin neuropeptides 2-like n=1 Tax=Mya arenaria TaxID=6604 RepID=UPI0022E0B8F1|nr:myomodulin neuropeptides 2-like [Mya arenaria]
MNYRFPVAVVLLSLYTVSGTEVLTNDDLSQAGDDEGSFNRVRRGGFSMLRLGRGLQMLRLGKRALPMLRLGRSANNGLNGEDLQYLLSIVRPDRQVPLPRYGKDINKDLALQYMLINALKNAEDDGTEYYENERQGYDGFGYGYPYDSSAERQIRPAPRPGYRYKRSSGTDPSEKDNDIQDKPTEANYKYDLSYDPEARYDFARVAPLMRYGKMLGSVSDEDVDEVDKRGAMRMLRLGRGMRMLRLGKRLSDSENNELTEADKRALRLLRLGKRPAFHMLRLGRGGEQEEEKRALRLLRLGKKSVTEES